MKDDVFALLKTKTAFNILKKAFKKAFKYFLSSLNDCPQSAFVPGNLLNGWANFDWSFTEGLLFYLNLAWTNSRATASYSLNVGRDETNKFEFPYRN